VEAGELHELVERIEHAAEHEHHPRIRTLVTVLIPVVTVLTALTSLLAARANGHAVVAQRERAVDTVAAQRAGEAAAEQIGRYDDINSAGWDANRRDTIELREAKTDPAQAAQLDKQAGQWAATQKKYDQQLATFNLAQLDTAGTLPQQQAFEAGRVAEAWVTREDADIGLAGLFAVGLFLLGLTLTLPRPGVKWGFVGVACLLGIIGVVRMALVNIPGVASTPSAALTDYSNAVLASQSVSDGESTTGDTTAVNDLVAATRLDSDYGQAWLALGEARDSQHGGSTEAVADYRRAIELDQGTAATYNNLSYDEVLLGRYDAAAHDAAIAHGLQPDNPYIDMTLAEAALGNDDTAVATHWRDTAVGVLSGLDSSFRDDFFAQLRSADIPQVTASGVPAARVDALFNPLRGVEASLDAFGSATPRPVGGASLTGLAADYYKPRAIYVVSFKANNIQAGDVVSLRVYDSSTEQYSVYSSYPRYPLNGSGSETITLKTPIDAGKHRIELYLNGNLQESGTVDSPGD
jgi:tetratricopeptide (TPR) repeat protein